MARNQRAVRSPAAQARVSSLGVHIPNVEVISISTLRANPGNARKHNRPQIRKIARSIKECGFIAPIIVDRHRTVIAGHGRLAAAELMGLQWAPCVLADHLTPAKARLLALADNRIAEEATWDDSILAVELKSLSELGAELDIEISGFEQAEIDLRIQSLDTTDQDAVDEFEPPAGPPVSRLGDIWTLGSHMLVCGNALEIRSYGHLGNQKAAAVITDHPYNVPIAGHVRSKSKRRHREFVMGAGELNAQEFQDLLSNSLKYCAACCNPGALIFAFMDWRHMREMLTACAANQLEFVNLCVWVKTNGALGSLYRSRHELIFVFKNGASPHVNNVQLGRFGRNRANVWNYAGANVVSRQHGDDDFDSHPTVKPVRLVQDALLDCTHRGELVLDPFIGSGTTMLASLAREHRPSDGAERSEPSRLAADRLRERRRTSHAA